jgi:hypothetical protein
MEHAWIASSFHAPYASQPKQTGNKTCGPLKSHTFPTTNFASHHQRSLRPAFASSAQNPRKVASPQTPAEPDPPTSTSPLVERNQYDTPLLRIFLPLAVVLGILMFIDAGFSGDWSRIGAITREQESELRSLLPVVVGGHGVCAIVAAAVSLRRNEPNWALRGLKTLAGGFVTLVEVLLVPDTAGR